MKDELRDKSTLLFLSAFQSPTNVAAMCTEKAGSNVTASPLFGYDFVIYLFFLRNSYRISEKTGFRMHDCTKFVSIFFAFLPQNCV